MDPGNPAKNGLKGANQPCGAAHGKKGRRGDSPQNALKKAAAGDRGRAPQNIGVKGKGTMRQGPGKEGLPRGKKLGGEGDGWGG